ncbi:FadR/GntR family transcriptional regulator [Paenibacillus cymbidii]|uniref:FadR/GntR family transcriptional regulator n=1 Tax=Paenibacillus cymbidii TaxID=1639034 RepID=UPI001080C2CC|nr:GntR family transcriptional regulator [Paenibacillus cymbidii]
MQPQAEDFKALSRMVSDRIKEYIVQSGLQPGDRLPPERKLAETLAVSRPVVRESLSHLETLGLVDKRQGRGVFVKEQSLSRLFQEMMFISGNDKERRRHLLEFRAALEQAAIVRIVGKVKSKELEPLLRIVEEAGGAETSGEFGRLDLEFHRKLIALSDNPYLVQLTDVIDGYFALLGSNDSPEELAPDNKKKTLREHRKLVELLKAGKRGQTLDLLQEHLLAGAKSAKPAADAPAEPAPEEAASGEAGEAGA